MWHAILAYMVPCILMNHVELYSWLDYGIRDLDTIQRKIFSQHSLCRDYWATAVSSNDVNVIILV